MNNKFFRPANSAQGPGKVRNVLFAGRMSQGYDMLFILIIIKNCKLK